MTCILVKVSDLLSTDSAQLPSHVMVKYSLLAPTWDRMLRISLHMLTTNGCRLWSKVLVQECYGVA